MKIRMNDSKDISLGEVNGGKNEAEQNQRNRNRNRNRNRKNKAKRESLLLSCVSLPYKEKMTCMNWGVVPE